jgi:uridine kinase
MTKINYVIKRNGAVVPFNLDRITNAIYRASVAVGLRDRTLATSLAGQVEGLLEKQTASGLSPTVEEIQDAVESVLIQNKQVKISKAYILYRAERARHRQRQILDSSSPSPNIPWAKMWHSLDWAVEHGVESVRGLNERIGRGELGDVIRESEEAYQEDLKNAADMIIARAGELKIVIITGPSSSGKTTSTIKVGDQLRQHKLNLVTMNIDNYFFDLEQHPKDEFGDYDFETPQALDLALINEHLSQLVEGKQVLTPLYDFKSGKRHNGKTPMQLKKGELILIDSLHGLYPDMTRSVPDEQKFKLYLEPVLQMKDNDGNYVRWTDIRLMRRMLRDAAYRAYDPTQTLLHWHYVRASEMLNIVPYNHTADYIVSSGMPYELSIYKPKLRDNFCKWVEEYHNDLLRADAFERAVRVSALLDQLTAIEDDSVVPKDSVIREFIGGSVLKY